MNGLVYLLAGNPHGRNTGADPAMKAFFVEVGKRKPHVAYIGTASDDDPVFFKAMAERLRASGAGEVTLVPLCGAAADPVAARCVLSQADAVFVSGGDVADGMEGLCVWDGMIAALRGLFAAGVPFMGLSAGSIMLARGWVHWAEDAVGLNQQDTLFGCLGFAPIYCDVHGESDGWSELKALLRLLPRDAVGYAIPAGGTLRLHDGVVMFVG